MIATDATTRPHSTADRTPELTVVMPCLNEARTLPACIGKALETMRKLDIAGEVLVVDNGSRDDSVAVALAAGARVVNESLPGYGNALRRGFAEAQGRLIIMGDCDESYDFTDLGRFVDRLRGGAELVMGNRLAGEIKPGAMPWLHRWIGNPLLSRFLNLLYRTGVGDSHCGMRGFTREACQKMNLQMPGMELASEMVIKSSLAGLRIEEIPITLWPDGRNRPPHLRSFRDGWRHLRFMLMCSPMFLFVLPGLVMTLAGLASIPAAVLAGYGVFDKVFGPNFMFTASLLSICGAHVMIFGFLAKLYAHKVDPVFEDPRVVRLARLFSVERGLACGLILLVTGILVGSPVLIHWVQDLKVPLPGQWIFAGTLFTLGVEVIFASFLVGIMDLPRESGRRE
jgi:glycosyltransferase involved in cell wall biosynthesis